MDQALKAYMGALGVDGSHRNYYILDGETGAYLTGSNDEEGKRLELTPNLYTALNEKKEGSRSDPTARYMDLAIPIQRGDDSYIIYILDKQDTVRELNTQLFQLILEALLFGLVISALLSFLLSRAMVTPIRALTRGARQVAEGDFSQDIRVESSDEIGVLTDTFNTMSGQLQDTLQQVDSERTKLSTLFLHMTDGVVAFDHEGEGHPGEPRRRGHDGHSHPHRRLYPLPRPLRGGGLPGGCAEPGTGWGSPGGGGRPGGPEPAAADGPL